MTTPVLYIYGLPENLRYTLVRSPNWQTVKEWLTASGVVATWTPRLRRWCVRTEQISDLIANAESAGLRVHMKGALS